MLTRLNYILSFSIGMMVSAILPRTGYAQDTAGAGSRVSSIASIPETPGSVLNGYIQEAFKNNEGLHQTQFGLEKSLYALQEARSLFLPNVSLQSSYTRAAGGRTIDVPIGDLLNNVYTTLNQLTATHNFPHLDNQSFLLNPDNYYDAHLHTTLPLVDAELWYNRQIKKQLITGQQAAVNVYKRELVKNIKTAYFQYYQAMRAIDIYLAALDLVKENIRVNESLLRNGVRNSTALTRSLTEQQRTISQRLQAENEALNARAYFNFLLNRPATDSVILDTTGFVAPNQTTARNEGVGNREELTQWRTLQSVNALDLHLEKSYIIPKLSTFLDLGSQGTGAIDSKTRYYFWGISLDWELFAGGQHRYKARQADADVRSAQAGYNETAQSLQLQLVQSVNNYHSAAATYQSAGSQLGFAEKYFTDQSKAYREGQLLYVELLDAENQLTNARLQLAQAYAGVQISLAQLERDQATYPINTKS